MLTLTRPLATQLLKLAQQSPTQRVCGLLVGKQDHATRVLPLPNVAADPRQGQAVEDVALAAAQADIAAAGERIIAQYYSHPDSPPVPSPGDLASLPLPDHRLLVISLDIKGVLEMRAFVARDGQAEEQGLQIF